METALFLTPEPVYTPAGYRVRLDFVADPPEVESRPWEEAGPRHPGKILVRHAQATERNYLTREEAEDAARSALSSGSGFFVVYRSAEGWTELPVIIEGGLTEQTNVIVVSWLETPGFDIQRREKVVMVVGDDHLAAYLDLISTEAPLTTRTTERHLRRHWVSRLIAPDDHADPDDYANTLYWVEARRVPCWR